MRFAIKQKKAVGLGLILIIGLVAAVVVKADWQNPSGVPPTVNQPRPVNISDVPQNKTGSLVLSNADTALLIYDNAPLVFGRLPSSGDKYVGLKAPAQANITASVIWTLPISDGANGYVLTTNGSGQLGWSNPTDLITQDDDWTYQCATPPCSAPYTSITSEWLTRIHKTGGNAELQIQSGTNNHWGVYQDNTTADLRFWNTTANNLLVLTTAGRVNVNGGLQLNGSLYDGAGNAGTAGQLLSRDTANANTKWIDPAWFTGAGFIYSTANTRVGDGGTVDYANGAGDLYVQNDLEVDGTVYLTGLQLANFISGSVIFQGVSGLAQDNGNFFWDDTNNRLGLGTTAPAQTLSVNGNIGLTQSATDGSNGAVFLNGKRFMHSTGQSDAAQTPYTGALENSNTFIGSMAGNFFNAADADYQSIVATENTGFGFYALNNNFDGYQNTALGSGALYKNGLGTAFADGGSGGAGSLNVAVGSGALFNNVSGNKLTAIGVSSLFNNLASEVTAVGYQAGYYNNSGIKNVFLGNLAGYKNTGGQLNAYLGYGAGYNNQTGNEDVYLGYQAGLNNTGSNNIFLGANAGYNETGSNKLYIEPSNANSNNALIYGQFYTASTTTSPLLRFNGKVGITPRGTAGFAPNKLLHIYQTSGDNAEIDIQSVSGTNKHWAIYNDRNKNFLTFWNDAINDNQNTGENKNMLTLALNGSSTDKPSLGIGTGLSTPVGHVEIRSQSAALNHTLNLSSFFEPGIGQFATNYGLGSNIITFTGGRYRVEGDGAYEFKPSAAIWSGFGITDGQENPSSFMNAKIAIQTPNDSGTLTDTIVAQYGLVGIGGGIDRNKNLRVYGSTMSAENWSDNDATQKGGSSYVCFDRLSQGGNPESTRLRFEDGLYICNCTLNVECGGNGCLCSNPP